MTSTLNPDAVFFVNGILVSTQEDDLVPMTLTDTVYNMCNWLADGVEILEGLAPEDIMLAWNASVESYYRHADMCVPDFSEAI